MPRDSNDARDGAIGSATESAAFQLARRTLESALRSSDDTILLGGPGDSEKLLLLDSIWKRPPRGFVAIPVPCRGASADEIAETILAAMRTVPVSDADGALARMMRTQSLRGSRPVLLLDDLEAVPLAALSRLRSIADGSRVEVRWIVAGSENPSSHAALDILPRPVRVVAVDGAKRARRKSESAMTSPKAAEIPRRPASSEPAERARAAPDPARRPVASRPPVAPHPVEKSLRPIRAGATLPPRSPSLRVDLPSGPPRVRPAKRARRRRLVSTRAIRALAVAIIGCAALALMIDRSSPFFAWATESTAAAAAAARERIGPTIRAAASDATAFALQTWNSITDESGSAASDASEPRDEPPVAAVEEPAPPPPAVSAEPPAPAPTAPPIQVGINSEPWSNVAVDDVDFGSTPLSVELAPGTHRFRAEMADGRIVEREIEVAEGRSQIVFR